VLRWAKVYRGMAGKVHAFLALILSKVRTLQLGVRQCSFVFRSSCFEPQPRDRYSAQSLPVFLQYLHWITKNSGT
jgi:hypothetical protein